MFSKVNSSLEHSEQEAIDCDTSLKMEISLLILIYCIVCTFVLCTVLVIKVIKHKTIEDSELIPIFEEFIKWNRLIQSKDAMKGFYCTLMETLKGCGIESFNMNLTKEEFEKLSLEKMRELNETALKEMIFELKK